MRGISVLKVKRTVFVLLLLVFLLLFSLRSNRYGKVLLEGLVLWESCVLPVSLPFLVVTSLCFSSSFHGTLPLQKLLCISKEECSAAISGWLCGYPVGCKTVSEFSPVTPERALALCLLSSACSPLFLLATVGNFLYQSLKAGLIVYLCHLLSLLILGAVACRLTNGKAVCTSLPSAKCGLYESMESAVKTSLLVGGFIAVFYTLSQMANDFYLLFPLQAALSCFLPSELAKALTTGMVEMTGGVRLAATVGATPLSLAVTCFLVTFGGGCVLLQQFCFLSKTGVKFYAFTLAKLMQGAFAAALCYVASVLFL